MPLDQRKKQILQAIVDDYVSTAEPVASNSLIQRHDFRVSSATVRNEMADLEQMGYLEQPHTSSGRVPSDKGYREYVDSLMRVDQLSDEEGEQIKSRLSDSFDELAGLLKKASSTLSEQTGFVSLALTPRLRKSYLKQLKMMMIEPGKVLVVVVLSAGIVKDRLVRIPDYLTPEQLSLISNSIESGLSGKPLEEITLVTVASAAKESQVPESLLNQILYEAYTAIKQADNLELYMDGTNRMLSLPEFSNISKARSLFDTLATDGIVSGYVNELSMDNERATYMIRIGQEISIEGLSDCSFVTTTYNVGDRIAGNIGVIGPKRMEYSKVISQISFVREVINNQMNRLKELNGGF
ncbi:MAG: heat-inducible transcription repressor HrcA [Clostridiaceae bacterium]|jgi:heat-inducible transcriptional repressor|nr:heat-inducible transcriptional repressor HrcA [Oscillospiraceae bacterium]NLO62801.1 heat-inducible transcription repressor HrcA [Clostridiaceae bacterium]